MHDYDKELVRFYEELKDRPFHSDDPVFIKRCLSAESPLGLVDRTARSLKREKLALTTEGFDAFTRSRVFSALGETNSAREGYLRILEESQDMNLRGKTLCNLAADSKDDTEREKFHKDALETGWPDAYATYGQFLLSKNRNSEAKVLLEMGLMHGNDLCLAVLGFMLSQDPPLDKHISEIEKIAALAIQKGINIERAFDRWDERIIGRKGNGETINILSVSRKARRIFKEMTGA